MQSFLSIDMADQFLAVAESFFETKAMTCMPDWPITPSGVHRDASTHGRE